MALSPFAYSRGAVLTAVLTADRFRLSACGCRFTAVGLRLSVYGYRLTADGLRLTLTAVG
ncbi:MAG: hypothetical protein RSA20_01930 [Oscillospiraceae bacterium]